MRRPPTLETLVEHEMEGPMRRFMRVFIEEGRFDQDLYQQAREATMGTEAAKTIRQYEQAVARMRELGLLR